MIEQHPDTRNRKRDYNKAYYEANKDRLKEYAKAYCKDRYHSDEKFRRNKVTQTNKRGKIRKTENPENYIFIIAKSRAKRKGLEFTITPGDIQIPKFCPILGIELSFEGKQSNSPSLDRVDNTKGYVVGNVRVISQLANRIKSNFNLETMERFCLYMKGEI